MKWTRRPNLYSTISQWGDSQGTELLFNCKKISPTSLQGLHYAFSFETKKTQVA
jgi:hypothetical protein